MSNVFQEKPFDFISEDLKHDSAFVYVVMSKVCEYVKGNYQHITKVKYFLMAVQPNIKITEISQVSATIIVILIWKQNGIS